MIKRSLILLVFIAASFGLLPLLPSAPGMKVSRLSKSLPEYLGVWIGTPREPGAAEKRILAKDTEFRRMSYHDRREQFPQIETSVVFSGKNLSQSIHRPEVCLRAQGWTFVKESYIDLKGLLPGGEVLPVKEMICKRIAMKASEESEVLEPYLNKEGEPVYLWRVFYYTFLGHEAIVAGHYERTFVDMKDRLVKGYDQSWAYATFSAPITSYYKKQGVVSPEARVFDEQETRQVIVNFLKEMLPVIVMPLDEMR